MHLRHYWHDPDWLRAALFIFFIALCFLGGGGARADVQSLLYLRPAAIMVATAIILLPGKIDLALIRVPLILLGLLAVLIAVQLIPLPPSVWLALPGHERFAPAAAIAGIEQPWRALSAAPDATLNSLVALIIPAVGLLAAASISRERFYGLLPVLIVAALVSALLAVSQLTTGAGSSLYLYSVTNEGAAVGLFANRNHQAVLMAMTFPMLSLWGALTPHRRSRLIRAWIVVVVSLLLVPIILVTGSRAGFLLGLVGLAMAYIQLSRQNLPGIVSERSRWRKPLLWAPWVLGGLIIVAAVVTSRASALERIISTSLDDPRMRDLPLFVRIAKDFFPSGSGFGSFDPIYRIYEPNTYLSPEYLNHAHNDLLELAITGGLAALVLLAALLIWLAITTWKAFAAKPAFSRSTAFARLGAILIAILLLGSLVDYPLRTPTMSLLFSIAAGWMCQMRAGGRKTVESDASESDERRGFT